MILGLAPFAHADSGPPRFDSAEQIELEGEIDQGYFLTPDPTQDPEGQARAQLDYLLGQINWVHGSPQTHDFTVQLGVASARDPASGLYRVPYVAQGKLSWNRNGGIPHAFDLILPARGDAAGLGAFVARYLKKCTNDAEAAADSLFYYYYPLLDGCPLADPAQDPAHVVARFPIVLRPDTLNTTDKSPEYGKVWEDGKLVVTAVFGQYLRHATSDSDPGIAAYNAFYVGLLGHFGAPTQTSANFSGNPGVAHRKLDVTFSTARGPLMVSMYLVTAIQHEGNDFWRWYSAHTVDADFVAYDGHAGLGININALASRGHFAPGQYQVYLMNGCDTFTHLTDELFTQHAAANPGTAPSKYLDIIENSMPTYFDFMAADTLAVISALVSEDSTYRQLLARFDPKQRAVVDGEEDNLWPAPFDGSQ